MLKRILEAGANDHFVDQRVAFAVHLLIRIRIPTWKKQRRARQYLDLPPRRAAIRSDHRLLVGGLMKLSRPLSAS